VCEKNPGIVRKGCSQLSAVNNLALETLSGTIVLVAPHMDDEALACGGLIAKLPHKERIYIIYATDGMKSPSPVIPGHDKITPDLGQVRMQESIEAMKLLGLPEDHLHFLCLPEARGAENIPALRQLLRAKIHGLKPDHVLIPFRYDRHPDHLAVNRVVASDLARGILQGQLVEYFVYYRWRLMPKRDIRRYIKPQFLYKLEIEDVAGRKREALDCYKSQTTLYYSWQTRPILRPVLLDEECQNPEFFLIANGSSSGTAVFSGAVLWIRLVPRLEPILQRWKYLAGATLKRMLGTHGRGIR
jgi:LmbE family N-acetylglucosaminyl deacetylase